MNRIISGLVFILYVGIANASNYYLSSSLGNYLNDGKKPESAWQSLNQLSLVLNTLLPGDSVLFRCDDTFSGQLILSKSGNASKVIYFGSYGNGRKPIISGKTDIRNWKQISTNLWEATCSDSENRISNFFINGLPQQIGRWPNANEPNKGYLSYETHKGTNQITDNQLNEDINWTGAEAVVRRVRWILDRLTIKSHTKNTLQFSTNVAYEFIDGFGYFIQNDIRTLDQQGEWYFNTTNKTVTLYSEIDPNTLNTQATKLDNLIKLNGLSYITLENLQCIGSGKLTLTVENGNSITVRNCEFLYSGENGVNLYNCSNLLFENNLINYTNNNALNLSQGKNSVLRNNVIKNTALIAGMGLGSDGQYNAFQMSGNNLLAEYNTIDSVGYIGLNFNGDNLIIKKNLISNYCMTKDDGGGLYTWSDGKINYSRKLIGNVLMNAIGAPEGSGWGGVAAEGIYIDDRSANVDIIGNTVFNCGNYGIHIHNANHITIRGNTIFNNGTQLRMGHDNIAPSFPITNCVVDSNLFVSKEANQVVASFETIDKGISKMGTFDYNAYCRPLDDTHVIQTSFIDGTTISASNTIDAWRTKFVVDQHSTKSPYTTEAYKILEVKSGNYFTNSTFEKGITGGWSTWSNYSNSKIEIAKGLGSPGNAMKASFTAVSGKTDGYMIVISNNFSFTKGNSYRLKFSAKSSVSNVSLSLIPRKNGDPYNNIAATRNFVVDTSFEHFEFLLNPDITEANTRIDFQIREGQGNIFFDNFELVEVDVEETNPDDYIFFDYNTTIANKMITIPDDFVDKHGKTVVGNVLLKPYTSILLFKETENKTGMKSLKQTIDFQLFPNPASQTLTILCKEDIRSIVLLDQLGQTISTIQGNLGKKYQLSQLPNAGLYFVVVNTSNGEALIKKLIVCD
jgi:parallel beta-helix repeat protein